jgi:hypothetical protein
VALIIALAAVLVSVFPSVSAAGRSLNHNQTRL